MWYELLIIVNGIAAVALTAISSILCLPRRFSAAVTVISFTVYTIALLTLNYFTGYTKIIPLPTGWTYIPLMLILFRDNICKIIFMLFSQFFISLEIILFFSMVFGFFVPYGTVQIFILMLIGVSTAFAVYIVLMFRFGKRLLGKFFEGGSKSEWALYMISILVMHTSLYVLQRMNQQNNIVHFGALLFLIWSFIILCYAVIRTHEKTRQKYEADFARNIITSGREHYEKMNEQFNALRILKHDYKFHLNTALNMLHRGEIEKSDEYLRGLQTQLQDEDTRFFCDNPVLNSLIADYARRCRELDIELDAAVSIPDGFYIPNYEMCIVLGNFMENAVEACRKLKAVHCDGRNRQIELSIKPQGKQLAIMVRNTFDGKVAANGTQLISMKKDGGIGLQSVRAVAERYCESFVTEYDDQWFSAFVLWKKGEK